MTPQTIIAGLFIAAGFAAWPIVGKYSGAGGAWVGVVIGVATAIALGALSARKAAETVDAMNAKTWVILAVAGLINGLAMWLYAYQASDPAVPTGIFVVFVAIMIAVMSPLLDAALNGADISFRQIAGTGIALVAIYLLGTG